MRTETDTEREARHSATIAAYRAQVDPDRPPKKPFLLEHHFYSPDEGDVTGLTTVLEEKGFRIDTFAYNPDDPVKTWVVVAVKLDLLEERRLLALSDELDELARQFETVYDGWLTRV